MSDPCWDIFKDFGSKSCLLQSIGMVQDQFVLLSLLWFSFSWKQRTTQLLSHSFTLPAGMGKRIRRKRQNSSVMIKTVEQNSKGGSK